MAKVSEHEEKMINLQTQLRRNQTELQDYLAGLDSWESDIKVKEDKLQTKSKADDKASELPPVRNTIHKKKLKKKKREKPVSQSDSNPKKISGFDFQAWDKFDVDKALEEVDKDEGKKQETSSSEYETDEEWELERKKHLAGQEKEKGNDFLKKGDIDRAVEAYSKGIELDPINALLPANRAMALIKQQKFAAAELDCTTSISLDPMYVKAYLRRATARSALGKLDKAVEDFNRVLDLEPTNKQAKTEIERLQKEVKRDEERPVSTTLTEDERGRVKPIYKPPEERSKKPLLRVPIEEIGIETVARPAPSTDQSELTKKISAKEEEKFNKLFISTLSAALVREDVPDENCISTAVQDPVPENKTVNSDTSEADKMSPPVSHPEMSHVKENGLGAALAKTPTVPVTNTTPVSSSSSSSPSSLSEVTKTSSPHHADSSTNGLATPQTSFQFQSDFKQLKRNPEAFFQYFQTIPCDKFPKLFGQSLDAEILTTILNSIALHPEKLDLYNTLQNLTLVKRFSMTAMFLSKKEKQVARDLLDVLHKSGNHTDTALTSLRKAYDL